MSVLLLVSNAHGLPVAGIYSERVPVANESDAERSQAFRAPQIVLVRATGNNAILVIRRCLRRLKMRRAMSKRYGISAKPLSPLRAAGKMDQQALPESTVQPSVVDNSDGLMFDLVQQRQVPDSQ